MQSTTPPTEVHHRIPRRLLTFYDRAAAEPQITGAGIQAWLDFEHEAARHGVADAATVTRAELARRIEASAIEVPYEEHRTERHTAADWRAWGSLGGRTTLARYGVAWFRALGRRRHLLLGPAELAAFKDELADSPDARDGAVSGKVERP